MKIMLIIQNIITSLKKLYKHALKWALESGKNKTILISVFFFILIVIALGTFNAEEKSLLLPQQKEPNNVSDDILGVVQFSPTGELGVSDLKKEIIIVFNHPVKALSTLSEENEGVFSVTPSVPGKFRWYGSRVNAFVPDRPFQPGTIYSVKVNSALKALNGKVISGEKEFSFFTSPLVLYHVYPYGESRISYDQNFTLNFNYPVSLEEVKRNVILSSGGKRYNFSVAYPYIQNDSENENDTEERLRQKQRVEIRPDGMFSRDSEVVLKVNKGLKPFAGNNGLEKESIFHFKTYGPLVVELKGEAKFYENLYSFSLNFNNPVNIRAAANAIRFSPPAKFNSEADYTTTNLSLGYWNLKPSTQYNITIDSSFKDRFGNLLTGERNFTVTIPRRQKYFSADSGINFIEASESHRIPLHVSAMETLNTKIGSTDISDLSSWMFDRSDWKGSGFLGGSQKEWKTGVTTARYDRLGFDLKPYLENGKTGWLAVEFFGQAERWDGNTIESKFFQVAQITDLGLVVKESFDYADVWVHSFSTGKPVKGANISSLEKNDKLDSCQTDHSGYCRVKKNEPVYSYQSKMVYIAETSSDKVFVTGKHHNLYMGSLSEYFNNLAALPSLEGKILFDRKLYRPGDKVLIKSFAVVRKNGKIYHTEDELGDLELVVTNSQGKEIKRETLTPSEQGGINTELDLSEDSPLGHYSISIYSLKLQKNKKVSHNYISDTLQVEEFRPVNFSVTTDGFQDSRVSEISNVSIEGKYLFGAPMQNAPFKYTLNRKPENLYVENYTDYLFGDDDFDDDYEPVTWSYYSSSSGSLGKDGKAEFSLKFPSMEAKGFEGLNVSRTYRMEIESSVTDISDKVVTNKKEIMVYPGKSLPGIRVKDRYQSQDKKFSFDIVTINAENKLAVASSPEIIIHQKIWKSIQSKGPGDSAQRKNTLIRKEVMRQTIATGERGFEFNWNAPEAGNYTITVKDGLSYTRMNFYAYGGNYIGWDFHDDDSITILPDRNEYIPGQKAKVMIQSPFKNATAIVSVERENLLWQKSVYLEGNGEPIEIPIKDEYAPNVYVSVVLLRPRIKGMTTTNDDEDMGRPMFKTGVVKLQINTTSYKLPLSISTDHEIYEPGEVVKMKIKTAPGAEITTGVADRGVLDLVNYHFGDPLKNFYNNWPWGVQMIENRHALVRQLSYSNKGKAPGGKGWADESDKEGGFGDEDEDGIRKDFRYTAYWNPAIIADKNGLAEITFKLPHNLTTFRIQTMAALDGKYATGSREFKVQKPVVLQSLMPRFIRSGDKLEVGAVVTNQTGISGKFKIKMKANLLIIEKQQDEFSTETTIENGESKEIVFKVHLNDSAYQKVLEKYNATSKENNEINPATIYNIQGIITVEPLHTSDFAGMKFSQKSLTDKVKIQLPVRETPVSEAFAISGFTDKKVEETIEIPRSGSVSEYKGGLDILLSSTALSGLTNGFSFYATNPYYCLEQQGSAFLLGMTSGKLLHNFKLKPPAASEYNFKNITKTFLENLPLHQNADGGFRLWKNTQSKSNPYLTAYMVFILQNMKEANEEGADYKIPGRIQQEARQYLKNYLKKTPKDSLEYVLESVAFMQYVLSRDQDASETINNMLFDKRQSLSLRAKGYLALAIAATEKITDYRKDSRLQTLMTEFKNRMQFTTRKIYFDESVNNSWLRTYYSGGSTFSVLLRAFIQLDSENPLIPQMVQGAIASKNNSLWEDTHSIGNLSYSLWTYHNRYEKENLRFTGQVLIGGKNILSKELDRQSDSLYSHSLPMKDVMSLGNSGESKPFEFVIKEKGRMYYTAVLQYAPLQMNEKPRDEGMEVIREIFPVSEKDIKSRSYARNFKRGAAYLVRLTVVNPKPVNYFMLNDSLPANAEVVNTGFETESSSMGRFLEKKRNTDNQEYWWMDSQTIYEYRDDRVLITTDYLRPGIHEYMYLLRGNVKGEAMHPPAKAFGMYEPERFGRSGSSVHKVE